MYVCMYVSMYVFTSIYIGIQFCAAGHTESSDDLSKTLIVKNGLSQQFEAPRPTKQTM